MALPLAKIFETEHNVSRRGLLKSLGRGAAALAFATTLTSLPTANDAQAGEAQAAIPPSSAEQRIEMADYAIDPVTRGIGVFINLRPDSKLSGDQIGNWIRGQFAGVNVPVDYRVNQASGGNATMVTLYVRDVPFEVIVTDLPKQLPEIYKHYKDVWLPETAALKLQQ